MGELEKKKAMASGYLNDLKFLLKLSTNPHIPSTAKIKEQIKGLTPDRQMEIKNFGVLLLNAKENLYGKDRVLKNRILEAIF